MFEQDGGKAEGSLVTKCLLKKYLSVIVKREITKLKVLLNMLCKNEKKCFTEETKYLDFLNYVYKNGVLLAPF